MSFLVLSPGLDVILRWTGSPATYDLRFLYPIIAADGIRPTGDLAAPLQGTAPTVQGMAQTFTSHGEFCRMLRKGGASRRGEDDRPSLYNILSATWPAKAVRASQGAEVARLDADAQAR